MPKYIKAEDIDWDAPPPKVAVRKLPAPVDIDEPGVIVPNFMQEFWTDFRKRMQDAKEKDKSRRLRDNSR